MGSITLLTVALADDRRSPALLDGISRAAAAGRPASVEVLEVESKPSGLKA